MLKNRKVRLVLAVAGGWLLVVFLGWLIFLLPIQVRQLIAQKGSAALGKDLQVRRLALNVFRLQAAVEDVIISEPNDGPALIAVDRLVVNISSESLFKEGIVLDGVSVEHPMVRLVRRADGSIDLAEIVAKPGAPKPKKEEKPSEPMAVLLNQAGLTGLGILVDDETVGVRHVIHGLDLSVGRVSTRPEDKGKAIMVTITDGRINGASLSSGIKASPFADTPVYAVENLCLRDVDAMHYLPYVPIPEGLRLNSAHIDLESLNIKAELPTGEKPQVLVSTDLRLRDVDCSEADGKPLLRMKAFRVVLAPSRPLGGYVQASEISLDDPEVWLARDRSGQLNWLRAIKSAESADALPAAAPEKKSELPRIRVIHLALNRLILDVADQAADAPFSTRLIPVSLALNELDTAPLEEGTITLVGASRFDERFDLDGRFSLDPLAFDFRFEGGPFPIAEYAPYYSHYVEMDVTEGTVSAGVRVKMAPGGGIDVSNGHLGIADLTVVARSDKRELVKIPAFSVEHVAASTKTRTASIGKVALTKACVNVKRLADGRLDLQTMLPEPKAVSTPTESAKFPDGEGTKQSETTDAPADTLPWQVAVKELVVSDMRLTAEDQTTETPIDLGVNFSLEISGISTVQDLEPAGLALSLSLDGGGTIRVSGTASVAEFVADLQVTVEDLALQPFEPYLRDKADVLLKAGTVWTKGQLAVDAGGDKPQVYWRGSSGIRSFALIEPKTAAELLKWEAFSVTGLDFQLEPMKIRVAEVSLTAPYAGLAVDADGTLNVQRILAGDTADEATVPESAETAEPTQVASEPIDLGIASIKVTDGNLAFRDGMMTPAADHRFEDFSVRLTNLSMRDQGLADLSIKGSLGAGSNLAVEGHVRPTPLFVDAELQLGGFQLSPMSPYSGRYIARNIGQGRLGLDLEYKVDGTNLKAENVMTLDQFELGKEVDSPDAVKLPLGLAIALLKDADGQILIDVPVEGDLADPEFNPWRVVWRVVRNLIVKAAASPFKVLASLAGSDKPLDVVPFAAGATDLNEEALARLKAMVVALNKRPGIKIGIGGQTAASDRDALRAQGYEALLRGQKAQKLLAAGAGAISAADIQLTDEERPGLEAEAYQAAGLPALEPLPEAADAAAVTSRENAIREALAATVTVADEDLLKLANVRAETVLSWFAGEGISGDRLFLGEPEITQGDQPQVHFKPGQ